MPKCKIHLWVKLNIYFQYTQITYSAVNTFMDKRLLCGVKSCQIASECQNFAGVLNERPYRARAASSRPSTRWGCGRRSSRPLEHTRTGLHGDKGPAGSADSRVWFWNNAPCCPSKCGPGTYKTNITAGFWSRLLRWVNRNLKCVNQMLVFRALKFGITYLWASKWCLVTGWEQREGMSLLVLLIILGLWSKHTCRSDIRTFNIFHILRNIMFRAQDSAACPTFIGPLWAWDLHPLHEALQRAF